MKLEVYSEKEIFEHIVLYQDEVPNWYRIFSQYSDLCLNITDSELENEEKEGTPIFEFIKANGGRNPIIAIGTSYFDLIHENESSITEKPRSVFFLDISAEDSERLQNDYGVIVQGLESLDDEILTIGFFKEFSKDEIFENGAKLGWEDLLNFTIPPSNSIVIADNFLFSNTERVAGRDELIGIHNIKNLLNAILPLNLGIDYHLTIITEDHDKSETWRNEVLVKLRTTLTGLRSYNINIELVFQKSEHYHKRRLIMNYVNASCDKGFCVFKIRCNKTVRADNDIRFNRVFYGFKTSLGDTDFDSSFKGLSVIKRETKSLSEHIASGGSVYLGAILGGCKADKTLTNRLINDV